MKKEIHIQEYSSKSTTYCISNLDKRKWAFADTIHNILDTPGSNKTYTACMNEYRSTNFSDNRLICITWQSDTNLLRIFKAFIFDI